MPFPSGTVTFLFTDIEGSTRLWEEHPAAMRIAIARHDALLRQTIEDNNGVVFKTIGDAFCAAFATASDAFAAALTAQLALQTELWADGVVLRVRMALHTGTAELRSNDYFGQPLNRVARLLATGHGGQVLCSDVVQELVRDTLSLPAPLKSLGEHRLRDLSRPETVFQLLDPGLPADFPPLKSLDNPDLPNNLPQQVTNFIGREKEIEAVKSLLDKTRLLTLVGSGGCGKTRLGLQVAAEVLEHHADGAWLVELAPLTDPAVVPQAVASVVGVREAPGEAITDTLAKALKQKKLLLVLDNCEHVLNAAARLVDTLLRSCPNVQVLASSREGLGIAGELTYRIPSLSVPDLKQTVTVESVSQYEAVQLFIERALFHLPAFSVTNQNAAALASICHRLDGIPLALELAAARVRAMPIEQIEARLDNRFQLLTGGSRTALPRQQTLRALIDWSYDLLTQQEKSLLHRLSVFAAGWTLEFAEKVCAFEGIADDEMVDLLQSLTDKSLVVYEEQRGQARYRLLETVRQYARERLEVSRETSAVRDRHRDCFLAFCEENLPKLRGAEQAGWLARLEEENENLRASLEWSLGDEGSSAGLQFCGVLQRFWRTRGHVTEGLNWCDRALNKPANQARTQARASALNCAGVLAHFHGDWISAQAHYEESMAIKQEIGDHINIAVTLNNLGNVSSYRGDYAAARAYYEKSIDIFREKGDRTGIAQSLNNLGNDAFEQGDYAGAREYSRQSLSILRETGDHGGIAQSLTNLGNIARQERDYSCARMHHEESLDIRRDIKDRRGIAGSLINLGNVSFEQSDYPSARAYYEESLSIQREIGDRRGIAISLSNLGNVALGQGAYVAARICYEESLAIFRETADQRCIAYSLEAFADLAAKAGGLEQSATLWGAAETLRAQIGSPFSPSEREKYEKSVAEVRKALGEAAFFTSWATGTAMTMEQAIDVALAEPI